MKIIGINTNNASIQKVEAQKMETATRAAVLFLLDESGSMAGTSIKNLNDAINRFPNDVCCCNSFASTNIEIAVMAFTSSVRLVADWKPLGSYTPVMLSADGGTDISVAVEAALRKADEKLKSGTYKTVHIVLISDGDGGDVTSVANEVARLKQEGKLVFWMLGVPGYDKKTAQKLTNGEHLYTLTNGKQFDYSDFIRILVSSVVRMQQTQNPELEEIPGIKTININGNGNGNSNSNGQNGMSLFGNIFGSQNNKL